MTNWSDLELLPHHVEVLKARGITPEVAQAHGYRSSRGESDLRDLGYQGRAAKVSGALVIPLHDADGEVNGYQIRPDDEVAGRNGKVLRYLSPTGQRNVVDVPVWLGARGTNAVTDPETPIIVTEGPLKAASAAARGVPCVSIQGVSSYVGTTSNGGKGAYLPDWRSFARNRHWIVGYDSDAMTKPAVLKEARRLGQYLGGKDGASVAYLMLPGADAKTGLDDWFVQHPNASARELYALTRDDLPDPTSEDDDPGDRLTVIARDLDVADVWVEHFADTCRFNVTTGKWMHFRNGHWEILKGDAVPASKFQTLSRGMWAYEIVSDGMGGTKRVDRTDWLYSANRIPAVLRQASANPVTQVNDDQFDRHPHLFNLSNGTYNLLAHSLLPHDPGHLLTGGSGVSYDATARAPQFEKFIQEVLPDSEVRTFVQRLFGMALLGEVREHVFAVFIGTGRNGKGALLEIMQALFGDYATGIHKDLLVETKFEGHPTHLMTLKGKRLAIAQELNKASKWDVAMVKSLTGGDRITGRYTGADEVTFSPSHTLVMATNHRPAVGEGEKAFWARYREVPFEQDFTGREDPTLAQRIIRTELPGVLQWVLDGMRDYLSDGLGSPDAVTRASASAREESDPLYRFAEERLERTGHADDVITNSDMFGAWEQWCREQDPREQPGIVRQFPKNFASSTGLTDLKRKVGKVWTGVTWKSDGVSQVTKVTQNVAPVTQNQDQGDAQNNPSTRESDGGDANDAKSGGQSLREEKCFSDVGKSGSYGSLSTEGDFASPASLRHPYPAWSYEDARDWWLTLPASA